MFFFFVALTPSAVPRRGGGARDGTQAHSRSPAHVNKVKAIKAEERSGLD